MTTIRAEFRVGNVLTTVDTSIVISITRQDTEQEIISSDAMEEVTIGKYQYEFDDPDVDLDYSYTIDIVHNGNNSSIVGEIYGLTVLKTYDTVENALLYFEDSLSGNNFILAERETQRKALVSATRSINGLAYSGLKDDPDQPNEFPREGVIPTAIKEAMFEIADALLAEDAIETDLSVTSRAYGPTRISFDRSIPTPWVAAGIYSKAAWDKLVPYLRNVTAIRLIREG